MAVWGAGDRAKAKRVLLLVSGGSGCCILALAKGYGSVLEARSCTGCTAVGMGRVSGGGGCVAAGRIVVGCVAVVSTAMVSVDVVSLQSWDRIPGSACEDFFA